MNNALNLINEDLQRHKVKVILPAEKKEVSLYLIMVTAKTKKLEDFVQTYGTKATTTHRKIAKKIFGTGETENIYGVFLGEDLKMVYAFNRDFADYDKNKKVILYKDVDDILVDKIPTNEETFTPPSFKPSDFGGGGGMVLRYSLVEKKKTN